MGMRLLSAITSQNGTAPKLVRIRETRALGAITSQNGTAPKPQDPLGLRAHGAITSQNGTAPKLVSYQPRDVIVRLPVRTALLQNQG